MYKFIQLSSLEKVMLTGNQFPEKEFVRASCLKNETLSYQIAFTNDCTKEQEEGIVYAYHEDFKVTLKSPLKKYITLRTVEYIPAAMPAYNNPADTHFISKEIGLYPDLLKPLSRPFVVVNADKYFSLWITLKLDGAVAAGTYPIEIVFQSERGERIQKVMELEIVDAMLPKQEMLFTQWLHADCIASYYQVKVFSKKHWELLGKFMKAAADGGVNLLLTPIFTPPLDTQIGKERPTVQLVDVEKTGNTYTFEFSKLRRWIAMAKSVGIENFEMAHLFSQWGAKAAPKIVVKENGRNKKLFGWHTPAAGDAYKEFLNAFLPALIAVLKEEGVEKNTFFHISDEPDETQLADYLAAKAIVAPLLKGFPIIDALSHVEFYKSGAVEHPVPSNRTVTDFIEAGVPDLWTYYCCSTRPGLCNRYMAMPSSRNRAIGLQLYKHNIKGFLHWGFNFYYCKHSKEMINPYCVSDAKGAFPSGDAYSVYPGTDGPWDSLRLLVFYDALQDVRALKLLESYIGTEETVKLMEGTVGETISFRDYVHCPDKLLALRDAVNGKIKEFV